MSPDCGNWGVVIGRRVISNSFDDFCECSNRAEQYVSGTLVGYQIIFDSVLLVGEGEGNAICVLTVNFAVLEFASVFEESDIL